MRADDEGFESDEGPPFDALRRLDCVSSSCCLVEGPRGSRPARWRCARWASPASAPLPPRPRAATAPTAAAAPTRMRWTPRRLTRRRPSRWSRRRPPPWACRSGRRSPSRMWRSATWTRPSRASSCGSCGGPRRRDDSDQPRRPRPRGWRPWSWSAAARRACALCAPRTRS